MNTHRPSDSARAFGGASQRRAGGTKPRRLLLWILLASVALASALCAYGCVVADTCEGDGTCPREDASSSVDAASDQDAGDAGNPGDGEGGNEAAAQDSIAPCSDGGLCAATGDGSIADGASVDGVALGDGAFVDGAIDARMCDPTRDPSDEPCVLDNAYGVFVASPGDAGSGDGGDAGPSALAADGSMAHPYPTIAQALANLRTKTRIYVCNGVFGEHVTVTTPVSIYGGLSCAAGPAGAVWSYVGGQAQVTPLSPSTALTVTGVDAGSITIEDVSFAAECERAWLVEHCRPYRVLVGPSRAGQPSRWPRRRGRARRRWSRQPQLHGTGAKRRRSGLDRRCGGRCMDFRRLRRSQSVHAIWGFCGGRRRLGVQHRHRYRGVLDPTCSLQRWARRSPARIRATRRRALRGQ